MKKRKTAVALKYEKEKDIAPKILAKGKGVIAEKIIEIAKEHKIPVYFDENLSEILSRLDLGDLIPVELYKVIAEILAWVYKLQGKYINEGRD
jgi:flagellar biosynthesis protein